MEGGRETRGRKHSSLSTTAVKQLGAGRETERIVRPVTKLLRDDFDHGVVMDGVMNDEPQLTTKCGLEYGFLAVPKHGHLDGDGLRQRSSDDDGGGCWGCWGGGRWRR